MGSPNIYSVPPKFAYMQQFFLTISVLTVYRHTVKTDIVKMPKLAAPLIDIQVKNAKGKDKPYKLADGGGLYLLVNPDSARYWRMDYRLNEKRNTLAFSKYPEISLLQARAQRTEARKLIKAEIDPARDRDQKSALSADAAANTFKKVARQWHANKASHSWQPSGAREA